jgi:hypothetical protein
MTSGDAARAGQAVGSGGNYVEGEEHVDAIILLMKFLLKLLALFCKHSLYKFGNSVGEAPLGISVCGSKHNRM